MRTPNGQFYHSKTPESLGVILTDDGGSGLYAACRRRFAPPEYEVSVDERHTVWVKRADGGLSLGLPPWAVREHSMAEVLDRVEARLRPPVATG